MPLFGKEPTVKGKYLAIFCRIMLIIDQTDTYMLE